MGCDGRIVARRRSEGRRGTGHSSQPRNPRDRTPKAPERKLPQSRGAPHARQTDMLLVDLSVQRLKTRAQSFFLALAKPSLVSQGFLVARAQAHGPRRRPIRCADLSRLSSLMLHHFCASLQELTGLKTSESKNSNASSHSSSNSNNNSRKSLNESSSELFHVYGCV